MKRHNRSEVAFQRYLRRFPSNSKIIQCVPKETTPCANKKTNKKILSLTRKYS